MKVLRAESVVLRRDGGTAESPASGREQSRRTKRITKGGERKERGESKAGTGGERALMESCG